MSREPILDGEAPPHERPMRFRRVEIKEIYFRDWICDDFGLSEYPMPENIRKGRNNAIILSFMEFFCCVASIAFYTMRRSRIILFLIMFAFMATVFGMYAKMKLSFCGLLTHAMFSISFIGGFYIYIMIDFALATGNVNENTGGASEDQSGGLSGTTVLLLASTPFLGLFFMGIYSCCLALMLESEMDARKLQKKEVNPPV